MPIYNGCEKLDLWLCNGYGHTIYNCYLTHDFIILKAWWVEIKLLCLTITILGTTNWFQPSQYSLWPLSGSYQTVLTMSNRQRQCSRPAHEWLLADDKHLPRLSWRLGYIYYSWQLDTNIVPYTLFTNFQAMADRACHHHTAILG